MFRHTTIRSTTLLILGAFLLPTAALSAQEHDHGDHAHGEDAAPEFAGDPYLLDVDLVSGEKLGPLEEQILVDHDGRELRFGSEKSVAAFRRDPAAILAKADAALVRQQLPFYPLKTCPVSGEELGGEMGEPVELVHRNRLVRLCCKGCKRGFLKAPGAVVAKLDAAVVAAQKADYPLETCVVSGEELGHEGEAIIEHVVGNRLLRLCCPPCKKKIARDPLTYLAKLNAARKARAEREDHDDGDHDHGEHEHDEPRSL